MIKRCWSIVAQCAKIEGGVKVTGVISDQVFIRRIRSFGFIARPVSCVFDYEPPSTATVVEIAEIEKTTSVFT